MAGWYVEPKDDSYLVAGYADGSCRDRWGHVRPLAVKARRWADLIEQERRNFERTQYASDGIWFNAVADLLCAGHDYLIIPGGDK